MQFWLGTGWMKALRERLVAWQIHASERMAERGFTRAAVLEALVDAECIESYPDDIPFPSALFLGCDNGRPIHIVASLDHSVGIIHIITVYEPDVSRFEPGFRKRRPN
ncbi:MAG: DUF4258 domain-containing protein [Calditrichaeota bacterium]|nr:DUF4258 domain-containing protein [Calditrichota bacterium]